MPRVQLNRMTRFALIFLRVYLIVMLALILYKFIKVLGAGAPPSP
jgi:hypothetical protein